MYEFKLPDLGEGIHEAEILKWYVERGERVEQDAPLVEVETDKAAVTIPSPVAGVVSERAGKVGDVIHVGQVVVVIDDGSGVKVTGSAPAAAEPAPAASAPTAVAGGGNGRSHAPAAVVAAASAQVHIGPVPAAPATRRRARELGVDLRQVRGTGPGGRVTVQDVLEASSVAAAAPAVATPATPADAADLAPSTALEPMALPQHAGQGVSIPLLDIEPLPDFSEFGPVETEPLRSIRRKVARKMVTSMVLVPHVAHMDDADVTELEDFRRSQKSARAGDPGIGSLTLLSFVIKAVTAGLRAAPAFNASLDPFKEEIVYKKYYNIGFAADTGRGLVVPVIKGTDRKSIRDISAEIAGKASQAREGKLPAEDMRGGTFTITNVGPLGGTAMLPTINYPEVAILGMGRIQEKPVVRGGEIVIRKMLPLTLAFDHRIADGADAARFVGELVRYLSDPNLLFLEA